MAFRVCSQLTIPVFRVVIKILDEHLIPFRISEIGLATPEELKVYTILYPYFFYYIVQNTVSC